MSDYLLLVMRSKRNSSRNNLTTSYVVNNYLKPLIGLATVRLIYMSIPDSCLWWFPHTKADLAMLSDTAQYSPIIKQAVKKVVPNALQADDFNAMPFI